MGITVCKNSKVSEAKSDNNSITIGIFGLDNAGKTSVVKAIGGVPMTHVTSTTNSTTTLVAYPSHEEGDRTKKDSKEKKRIQVIDVSGEKKYRQDSWSKYYDQLHGLIFVVDASERRRWNETRDTLDDLLQTEQLSGKPILILANKQDQPDAIDDESEVKHKLELKTLKSKFRLELCTAWPQDSKSKVDPPIRDGWSWLIRTIEDNYSSLNSRIMKTKKTRSQKQVDRSESEENNGKLRDSKRSGYPSSINTNKLPSIHAKKTFTDDDDDDVRSSALNNSLKKKKALGSSTNDNFAEKSSNHQQPQPFRSTYERFPEEVPWSTASISKSSKLDDQMPKFYSKPPMSNSTRKRDVSPLVHDTKPSTYGSSARKTFVSDDDDGDGLSRYPKSIPTSRFEQSSLNSSNRLSVPTKKTPSDPGNYDDAYYRTDSKSKMSKTYDSDEEKSNRPLYNNGYRSGSTKQSRFDDDDDDDEYSPSASNTRAPYNSVRASATTSKTTTRSTYDDYDRSSSPSKLRSQSKFDDDDYRSPPSKPLTHSRSYGKNDDDDDDNDNGYPKSTQLARSSTLSKTNYYSSSYDDHQAKSGVNSSRTRYDDDDYLTAKNRSTISSSSRTNNLYDD